MPVNLEEFVEEMCTVSQSTGRKELSSIPCVLILPGMCKIEKHGVQFLDIHSDRVPASVKVAWSGLRRNETTVKEDRATPSLSECYHTFHKPIK